MIFEQISQQNESALRIVGGYKSINVGYVRYIYLIPFDSCIDSLNTTLLIAGQVKNAVQSDGIVMKENTIYNLMLFPPKSCTFSENHIHGMDGEEYAISIDFSLPRADYDIRDWIHRQNNRRWIAIFQDTNGYWYQGGDLDCPLIWDINTQIAKENTMKFSLKAKMWHPAWMLTDPLLYGVVPNTDCSKITQVLGCGCKAEIEEIKKKLENISGITLLEKTIDSGTTFTENVYYEFSVGNKKYNVRGISPSQSVLLDRLQKGEICVEEKSVRLYPISDYQFEFIIPDIILDKKIAKFAINHINYSEGIEYEIIEINGAKKIRWVSTEFEIMSTDLVEIIYLHTEFQTI